MKKDVAEYVSKYLTCQNVKAEQRYIIEELQPIKLPEWKLGQITMNFVVGLPRTVEGYDVIWVVMDQLTKSAHFIPIKVIFLMEWMTHIYIVNIVSLHRVPLSIISDRNACFTS